MSSDKRKRPRTPWTLNGRRVGFVRGGTYYIHRALAGRNIRISTGCVDADAAAAEYRKFELNPVGYVSPLGRDAVKRRPRGRRAPTLNVLDKAERRDGQVARLYGLSPAEVAALRLSQGDACAICFRPALETEGGVLEIDHDHATGEVRGLLCGPCNRGLGHFGDSPERLRLAIRYLDANRGAKPGAIAPPAC